MKTFMLFSLFILSLLAGPPSQAGSCDLTGKEQNFLDRVISRSCGTIPFPIQKISSYGELENGVKSFPFMRIALGRSLVRDKTDLANPRYVTALTDMSEPGLFIPLLFMGYVPHLKQIEVITWNQVKSRYDFLLVENYGDKDVKVIEPPRTSCTSCHQNEGPILSRAPWSEIEAFRNGMLIGKMDMFKPHPDAPPTSFEPGADGLDSRVRFAENILDDVDTCQKICKTAECRRDFFLTNFAAIFSKQSVEPEFVQTYSAENFKKKYLGNGLPEPLGRPSSILMDRNPLKLDPQGHPLVEIVIDPKTGQVPLESYSSTLTSTVSSLTDSKYGLELNGYQIQFIPDTSPYADPLTPRPIYPKTVDDFEPSGFQTLMVCYKVHPKEIRAMKLTSQSLLQVANLASARDFYKNPLPSREQTLAFLNGQKIPPNPLEQTPQDQEEPSRLQDPRQILQKHCGSCHGSGPLDSLGSGGIVLPLGSVNELRAYRGRGAHRTVESMLKNKIMPPKNSSLELSDQERSILLKYLNQL